MMAPAVRLPGSKGVQRAQAPASVSSSTLRAGIPRVLQQPVVASLSRTQLPQQSHRAQSQQLCGSRNSSSAFGKPAVSRTAATSPHSFKASAGVTPWIHAAAYRRGKTLVVCASLAGIERPTSHDSLLSQPIEADETLLTGQLPNGMKYVILPNKLPPGRFEAHLEVHVGSVDEGVEEQGVAHLVEHVTFLGSKKRENLLGTGARANAYTDFHHTVFHVHAPAVNSITNQPMLSQVLDALSEIAFAPQFAASRIEKERKAVLAEAQMMNTIEYRVDCQLLAYLHHENNLGCRFPIGKTEQVKTWPHDAVKSFHQRWYFPANVTLYVVGDLDRPVSEAVDLITKTYGSLPAGTYTGLQNTISNGNHPSTQNDMIVVGDDDVRAVTDSSSSLSAEATLSNSSSAAAADAADAAEAAAAAAGGRAATGSGMSSGAVKSVFTTSTTAQALQEQALQAQLKQRHAVRPPVDHKFGAGPLAPGEQPAPVSIFRHPLLQHFMLSVFCKLPLIPMTRVEHLQQQVMIRIILSAFQFRINARYVVAQPCFVSIGLDISDSGREGCSVSTLTVTSEPKDWEAAVAVGVQEIRRLQKHGITPGEFNRYRKAIMRDSAQLAEQSNKIPSLDTLNFVMESIACGHTVMAHKEAHKSMSVATSSIEIHQVNALAASMLAFSSHFGHEAEVLQDAAEGPAGRYASPGPTRATSLVACIPAYMDASGESISAGVERGGPASIGADGHIDADDIDLAELEKQAAEGMEMAVPEGAIRFDPSPAEIAAVLADNSAEVEATLDVDLPEHLLSPEQVDALVLERQPRFVPLGGEGTEGETQPGPDSFSQVYQRRLSNGIRINYRKTDFEPCSGLMRLAAPGGRMAENSGVGPDGFGAVVVGARALSEAGTVGPWSREQCEVFCVEHLITSAFDADEENIMLNTHFSVTDGGMQKMFEMVHLFLDQPVWDENAMERAKQTHMSMSRSTVKSLSRASAERIMVSMLGGTERRWREPLPEEIDALTLDGMRKMVGGLFHAGNLEVNIVGDFDPEELEMCILKYLGTLRPSADPLPIPSPVTNYMSPPMEQRHQNWHLTDSDERACAYIAGPAPCRWGPIGYFGPLDPALPVVSPISVPYPALADAAARKAALDSRRNHPLFASVVLMVLTEIINSRLFTTVRDSLGLTYDVSFEVMMFDRVRAGWFSVDVTSHPDKIHDALAASVSVLRDVKVSAINKRELSRAKITLLTRHEADLKDNEYWLGLMTHVQSPTVPHKSLACLRDLKPLYEALTIEDVYHVYNALKLDDANIFTCVGTSGKVAPPPRAPTAPGASLFGGVMEEEEPAAAAAAAPNPMTMFTAMLAAAQAMDLNKAIKAISKPKASPPTSNGKPDNNSQDQ